MDANVSIRPAGETTLGTKTELKNMNSFRFLERGIEAEIAPPGAAPRRRRARRAGDAALRPAVRRAQLAALQGGGARLPLLPRARPRAAGADRADARARPRRAARAAGRARRALRVRARPAGRRRQAARLPHRAGRLLRGHAGCRRRRERRAHARQLGHQRARRRVGDGDPSQTEARAGRARGAGGDGRGQGGLARRPPRRCSTTLVERGRRPARDRRASRASAGAGEDELARSSSRRWPSSADAVEKIRAGNDKAIGAIVGAVMRATKGRADGGEVQRMVRERL